jgi:hypothetical protein
MLRTNTPLRICVATVFLWGCKDKPIQAANPAPKPPVEVAVAKDPAANLPVAQNLGEQLQVEAASRPADALKAEVVLEALGKAGIQVTNTKQFIARTVAANYCFGGVTPRAASVTICEYGSPEAAMGGMEHSLKQFAGIPNRTLTQNKRTVLTLVRAGDAPEEKADIEKAIEVFKNL